MKKFESQAIDQPPEKNSDLTFQQDLKVVLAFFTRLPIKSGEVRRPLAASSRAFGVAGLVIGGLAGMVFWLASLSGLTAPVAAILAVAALILITGGLHEDGLADVADGFGGGWDVARKLDIMRDSNVGTYGMLALVISTGLRVAGYATLFVDGQGLFASVALFAAVGCFSRASMPFMMLQLKSVRSDGRAYQAGKPSNNAVRSGLLISGISGGVLFLFATGIAGVAAALAGAGLAYYAVARIATRQIGGYTGDVLGSLQQISELLILCTLMMVA